MNTDKIAEIIGSSIHYFKTQLKYGEYIHYRTPLNELIRMVKELADHFEEEDWIHEAREELFDEVSSSVISTYTIRERVVKKRTEFLKKCGVQE